MRVLLLSLCLLLGGCAAGIEDYQGTKPALELDKFFNGKVLAHGMFQDYSGKVIKRFTVVVEGKWQGNIGTLDEHFTYSDGSTQRRVWTLEKLPGGQYQGQASDVIGTAKGKAVGMAFQWGYTLRLTMDDGDTLDVTMDDWMYQLDARHLMNRTTMKKFGLAVGEVTLFFEKQ
ncbi:MAG: DUF3833 domain-containing protein [Pseudomonadota bacterium]|uniref:DUF3833 domain-containing protein n=1 Tax=Gallaecimonas pentaromativorans TaxID=584787 RepID=UPI00067F25B1|nr:DUF3833 domain-containing protein [Gallaecimonas pentaromativorans]MED5525501.1 DUF3833 domain-containing protein [Pseudomonadota bacterium]